MIRPQEARPPLTVTELSAEVRDRVRSLATVVVKGEVSGVRRDARGRYSFVIKDEQSAVRAWIWDDAAARMPVLPADGQQYVFRGRCDFWRSGTLTFVVDQIRYDDIGRLHAQLEALKKRLELEGAFAAERKRPLPFLPRAVALITSPTGAVIHDLQETILERFPNMEILVYPAQVQGTASPASVVMALRQCNREARADVVVIARGGGSFEELYGFNTEPVVRAIMASPIAVVTALGHTSDRTVADMVADRECRTPTAAGETVVPRKADLARQLAERQRRLIREVGHVLRNQHERLEGRRRRLVQILPGMMSRRREQLALCEARIRQLSPTQQLTRRTEAIGERRQRLDRSAAAVVARRRIELAGRRGPERMTRAVEVRMRAAEQALAHRRQRLEALSPQSVLTRGYSITFDDDTGTVLRAASDTRPGRKVRTRLAHGEIGARVEETDTRE